MKKSSEELLQELQEVDALIAKKQPLTGEERQRLKEIRERGFLANIREGAIRGQSLKQTISQNFKAKTVGIKEKFNPLNIAKSLVGKTGASLLGKTFGTSKDTMKYFLGDKKSSMSLSSNRKLGSVDTAFYTTVTSGQKEGLRKGNNVADVAGKLFNLVRNHNEKNKLDYELQRNFEQELHEEEERRHKELIEQIKKSQTAKLGKIKKEPKVSSGKIKKISKEEAELKPTTPSAPAPAKPTTTAPTPAKPTTPSAPAPAKPTTPSAPAPAKPTTTTPAPAKPTTATPITPSAPISTAQKIITGAAITAGAKESLAMNISKYESGKAGYNAYNKGTVGNKMIPSDKPIDFSKMTISQFLKRGSLKSGDPERLFAVGKYQIIPATMKDLVKQLKLDPDKTYLDPKTQDLLFNEGLVGTRRKKVDDYIKGRSDDRDGAILQLAQEFASVGVPYPAGKAKKRGESYYSGVGGNKAHNSPEEVGKALDLDRAKFLSNNKTSLSENKLENNTGNKIDSFSKENKDLKGTAKPTNVALNNSQTIINAGNKRSTQVIHTGNSLDLPLFMLE